MADFRAIPDGEKVSRAALLGTSPQDIPNRNNSCNSDLESKPAPVTFTVRPPHAEHHLQQQRKAAQRLVPGQSSISAHAEQRARTRMRQQKKQAAILSISQPSEITHIYPTTGYAEHTPMHNHHPPLTPTLSTYNAEPRIPRSTPLLASPHMHMRSRSDFAYEPHETYVPNYAGSSHHAVERHYSDVQSDLFNQSHLPQLPNHRTRAHSLPRNAPSEHIDTGLITPTPIARVASPILKPTQNGTSHGMMAYSRHYEALEREMQIETEETFERSRVSKERRELELERKVRNIAARRLSSEAKISQFTSFQTIQSEIQKQQKHEQQQHIQYQSQQKCNVFANSGSDTNYQDPLILAPETKVRASPVPQHRTIGGAIPIIDPTTGDRLEHAQPAKTPQPSKPLLASPLTASGQTVVGSKAQSALDFNKGAGSHLRRGVPSRLPISVRKKTPSRVLSNGMCVQELQDLINYHQSSLSCDAKIFDVNSSQHIVNSTKSADFVSSLCDDDDDDDFPESTLPSISLVSQGVSPLCQSFESLSVRGDSRNKLQKHKTHPLSEAQSQTAKHESQSPIITPSVLGAYKRFSLAEGISPSCEALVDICEVDNAIEVGSDKTTAVSKGLSATMVESLSSPSVNLDSTELNRNSSVDSFSAFQTMLDGIKEASTTALAFPGVDQYNSCDTLSLLFAMDGASSDQSDPIHNVQSNHYSPTKETVGDISADSSDDDEGNTDMSGSLHNLLKSAAHLKFVNSLTDSEDDTLDDDSTTAESAAYNSSALKRTRPRSVSTRDFYNTKSHTSPSPSPNPARPSLYNAIFSTASPMNPVRKSRFDTMGKYSGFETYGDTRAFVFPSPSK